MKINEALNIIYDSSPLGISVLSIKIDYIDDEIWQQAFETLTESLGVFYDKNTEQFITTDTGDVI